MIPAVTRWIAAAGAGVISLDSIINVAFPAMAAAFAEPPERVRWVIVCYVFTYALTAFSGGALADRVGHARVFRVGLLLTAVALTLGVLAPGALAFLANASIFSVWLLAPFYLVLVRGLDALTAGLLFTLTPLGTAAAAPVAGVAAARLGARGPMIGGLALEALGLLLLSRADATTSMPMIAVAL